MFALNFYRDGQAWFNTTAVAVNQDIETLKQLAYNLFIKHNIPGLKEETTIWNNINDGWSFRLNTAMITIEPILFLIPSISIHPQQIKK